MEVTAFLFICGHCRETEGRRERVVFGAEGGGRGETKVCEFDGRTAGDTNDAKTGLLAAARISDQLEGSQRLIADQKEESKEILKNVAFVLKACVFKN